MADEKPASAPKIDEDLRWNVRRVYSADPTSWTGDWETFELTDVKAYDRAYRLHVSTVNERPIVYPTFERPIVPEAEYAPVLRQISERMMGEFALLRAALQHSSDSVRAHVSHEAEATRKELGLAIAACNMTVLECFKYNAARNIQLTSAGVMLISVASLIVSVATRVHLLHPVFALFSFVMGGTFYLMSKLHRPAA